MSRSETATPVGAGFAAILMLGFACLSLTAACARELQVSPNVWMDPKTRFPADDRYNPGELVPQVEAHLGVDPADPKHLVVSAAYFARPLSVLPKWANARCRGPGCTLYSNDAGQTWTPVREPFWGEYNLRVAYSRHYGDAYRYGVMGNKWIDVQRSEDHGKTWISQEAREPVDGVLPCDGDHPCLVVDNSPTSPFYGRIYLVATHGYLWSNDQRGAAVGFRRSATIVVTEPSDTHLIDDLCVLRGGEVVVAYREYVKAGDTCRVHFRLRLSTDGGKTLTEARQIVELPFNPYKTPTVPDKVFYVGVGTDTPAALAVDPTSGRFYCAYLRMVSGKQRVFVIRSDDQGKTWTQPVHLSPSAPEDSNQYQVRCAVDERGNLGVAWFDTRLNPGDKGYDLYFALSQDQAKTFQEVRVSSASSQAVWTFNQDQVPLDKWVVAGFDSRRHLTGGDYIGLAVDANNDFVMAWPDCRHDHRQQMYFAHVRVKGKAPAGK